MNLVDRQTASLLLKIGAIKMSPTAPFTWASGWRSPIYCDNRLSLSFPEVRNFIKNELVARIKKDFPDVEGIAGVATAGIPQGALVADAMGLPFVYVRSQPKDHGLENMIEGKVTPGQRVVVVEDLISTGGSSIKAALALREVGFQVLGLAAIFTYGFEASVQNFKTANIPFFCLTDYETLLEVAVSEGQVSQSELNYLQEWRQHPAEWGRKN
jgi:orotate phosphoribosyltransferase